ncbi:MAG: hypothetical protein Q7U74_02925 [Saprospiraceae bacterium]|nr:hypothetical protein [Saprospiraceae bacterium]
MFLAGEARQKHPTYPILLRKYPAEIKSYIIKVSVGSNKGKPLAENGNRGEAVQNYQDAQSILPDMLSRPCLQSIEASFPDEGPGVQRYRDWSRRLPAGKKLAKIESIQTQA